MSTSSLRQPVAYPAFHSGGYEFTSRLYIGVDRWLVWRGLPPSRTVGVSASVIRRLAKVRLGRKTVVVVVVVVVVFVVVFVVVAVVVVCIYLVGNVSPLLSWPFEVQQMQLGRYKPLYTPMGTPLRIGKQWCAGRQKSTLNRASSSNRTGLKTFSSLKPMAITAQRVNGSFAARTEKQPLDVVLRVLTGQ